MTRSEKTKPESVSMLERIYGGPSQDGFGSAVFFEHLNPDDDIERQALEKYKFFVGGLWERYGEDAWMGPWKEVYARKLGANPDIVTELRNIGDPNAATSASMIVDNLEDVEKAHAALAAAYDDPMVTDLRFFNLGDGEAMSGLLIAGRRTATGEAAFLAFLMD